MTYNEKFFEPALNKLLRKKLDSLLHWQDHSLEYLIKYLLASNGKEQLRHCECFLQLLAKIRFNIEAANVLLPMLYDDYRFKTSVNVVYRTIIDDIINSYYLFGTINLADNQQQALNNELNILHKEFLISSVAGIDSDREFEKFVDKLKEIDSGPDIDVKAEFRIANPELFNERGDWKKNSEIRFTTLPYFLTLFNQSNNNPKAFISESKKLEFIKSIGVTTCHNISAIFKYLSQYQHFSPKVHDLLNSHIEYDVSIYQRCLGEVVMLLDQLSQFLILDNKEELKKEWDNLSKLVFDSFSEA